MQVSYNWLKTLVKTEGIKVEQLVDDLSTYSVEVEALKPFAKADKLIIGHVIKKEVHPKSDHLFVCLVDIGDESIQIVCGAPNVDLNQKVMVVLPGGHVNNHPIGFSKIRGVESNGMICSYQEIGIENKYVPSEFQAGIAVLASDAPIGMDALTYLGFDDYIIELGLTPNRMDLLSMMGVARDINAIYQQGLIFKQESPSEAMQFAQDELSVLIETADCYSYYAKIIDQIEIKESPAFIKQRLMASGIRPINNVVDITNYILILYGQPLHAFDASKIGKQILVRNARENEEMITLDHQVRKLKDSDILITDGTHPIALGGVMGGLDSSITNDTQKIILEGAVFAPQKIRTTSTRLGLRSESSIRFERGVDLNTTLDALNHACYLLEHYASGHVFKGEAHHGIVKKEDQMLEISGSEINQYLGIKIDTDEIAKIFTRLEFGVKVKTNDLLQVSVPNRRLDIKEKVDLIEEVARIHGYNLLKETLPQSGCYGELTKRQKQERLIEDYFRYLGLRQVISYSLISQAQWNLFTTVLNKFYQSVYLMHPMSEDKQVLRKSLLPSLIEIAKYNQARQMIDNAFFEIGKNFFKLGDEIKEERMLAGYFSGKTGGNTWRGERQDCDFYYVKGLLENLFSYLGYQMNYVPIDLCAELHPKRTAGIYYHDVLIGFLGEIHPKYANDEDLNLSYVFEINLDQLPPLTKELTFKKISRVPKVERDLAFLIDEDILVGELVDAIYKINEELIQKVIVFDIYQRRSDNKKSVAFRIDLESQVTLTEEVINQVINQIIEKLTSEFNAQLRF